MFHRRQVRTAAPAAPRRGPLWPLALAFFMAGSAVAFAQDVANNSLVVDANVSAPVCGNTSGTNTDCSSADIPSVGSPDSVHDNTVTVELTGTAGDSVYGGLSQGNGEVSHNEAHVAGTVTQDVTGGFDYGADNTASVQDNAVTISGTVGGAALGGHSLGSGEVTNNRLEIAGAVGGDAQGGYSEGGGDVAKNTVTIKDGGSVGKKAYGGTGSALVTENSLTINGTVEEDAYGGYGYVNGAVAGNILRVGKSGTVNGDARGGFSEDGSATGNILTVDGAVKGEAYGGAGNGIVTENALTIAGEVTQSAYGGASFGAGAATGNTLTIKSTGAVRQVAVGGYGEGSGDVSDNSLTVDGTVGKNAYGGYSGGTGNISGNFLTINNAVQGSAYGGYIGNPDSTASVVNNTISLKAGSSVGKGLYGGYTAGSGDASSGNTLIVGKAFTGSVTEVQNFTHYDFDLAGRRAGETIITVTGQTPTDLTRAGRVTLRNRDIADIFSQGGGALVLVSQAENGGHLEQSWSAPAGPSRIITARLEGEGRLAIVSDGGLEINPQSRALNQAAVAGGEALRRGQDALIGYGIDRAGQAAYQCPGGPAAFASVRYDDYRLDTGSRSHNDVDSWSALAGLALAPGQSERGWLAGLFFEGGIGEYHARDSFPVADTGSVRSSGDVKYYGGGLFARYLFESRFRLEASARYGRVESDYRAKGWAGEARPDFDLHRDYYGGHLGLGYEALFGDLTSLDLSAGYLWTRQEAKTATVLDEKIRFGAYDSSRLRAGGRLLREVSPGIRPYLGFYGEYEFDGASSSRNLATGDVHDKIRTRGATGIVEAGVSIPRGEPCCGFTLDLSVDAQFGRREGWGGQAALTWSF